MNRLENIDRLFSATQLLTPDDKDSGMLFREAFDGSLPDYLERGDSDQLRRSFYAKLISILRQNAPADGQTPAEVQSALRARIQRDIFDRVFPSAFVQLKPGEQLLLFLTSVEGYDPDSIAEITGFETDHAGRQIDSVFSKLEHIVQDATVAQPGSHPVSSIPRSWISENLLLFTGRYLQQPNPALHRFVESRFSPGIGTMPATGALPTPNETRPPRKSRPRTRKMLAAVFTIFFTGLAGIIVAQYITPSQPATPSVFELSVEKAREARSVLPTDDPAKAEQFIRTHFGRIIMVPKLQSATLSGIGSSEVIRGQRVPTMIYRDVDGGQDIVVFGYSYALLRDLSSVTLVGESLLRSLEEPGLPIVEMVRDHPVVVWRVADDILFAVLPPNHANPEGIL